MATLPSEYRYWAFISYSSKDKAWGRWLHRAIETYGIPAQLVSHPTPAGHPAPKRFQPLFRDRDELPASADLARRSRRPCASRYLIVVCSRHAAQSKWVDKEIETFQKFDRHGLILAVIVDGEPNAGDERECFPPALRRCEPIAADARPQGDGKANAKLKVLAGMLGVGFDALKQRDTQRRIRRLQLGISAAILVALGLFVLALGMVGLASFAFSQRNKAVQARQQAESVLDFLVFDLRDELEKVGRLDVVDKVQKRVDKYYREMGIEKSLPTTLYNQSAALVNVGKLALDKGDLAGALKAYRESLAIAERLAAQDPTDARWQHELAAIHSQVGGVLRERGDAAGALREYRASMAIAARLAALHPTNVDWQRDLSAVHQEVGAVLLDQGDAQGALGEFRASMVIVERLAAQDPTNTRWHRDLSISHNMVGNLLLTQGDAAGALKEYRASMAIFERLAAQEPTNAGLQHELSISHEVVANVLSAQGDAAGALGENRASMAIAERLAAQDPTNVDWQRGLSLSHLNMGNMLLAHGRRSGGSERSQGQSGHRGASGGPGPH